MCPFLGMAIIDANTEVSIQMSTLSSSTIHFSTPIKDWKYAASLADNSGEMSTSGL